MLKNYLITALRNLRRNKVYAALNIFGLALGIGCALVVYGVIRYEMSYDQHEPNLSRIYRIVHHDIHPDRVEKGMGTPHPLGPALIQDFPEVQNMVRTHYAEGDQINIRDEKGDLKKFLFEEGLVFTENAFFNIFHTTWVVGDPEFALTQPRTAVISRSVARQLFELPPMQEHQAMGRTINYNNLEDFTVVGVIEDPLKTSSLPFTLLFDYPSQAKVNPYYGEGTSWNSTSSNTNTYFLAAEGFDVAAFDQKLVGMVEKYRSKQTAEELRYFAQPMHRVHFDREYRSYPGSTSPEFLFALGMIGIFLVITACINFVNLATAQAVNRSKEIGIRKAIGGLSRQLVVQFMAEIGMITLLSLLIALGICEFMFGWLQDIIGVKLTLAFLLSPEALGFLVLLFVGVSLLSGFYPAWLLSRMNAVLALKNKISARQHAGGLPVRKALVIVQFAISQFLIIGTLIIGSQTKYFLDKDLGFQTNAILTHFLPERDVVKMERFRQQLLTDASVQQVSFALSEPTGNSDAHSNFNYAPLGSKSDYNGNFKIVDEHYMELFEISLLAGRGVKKTDTNQIVINRKLANLMGFEDRYAEVIGEKLTTGWYGGEKVIVGVTEDFHTYSLSEDLDYVIFLYQPEVFYSLAFKLAPGADVSAAMRHFEKTWETVYPEYVIDLQFYDEELANRYEEEQHVAALMRVFSIISILIGCLGLYGLMAFIAANKAREIGVRKVLGASVGNILMMFSREVLVLLLVAFALTTPLAYYVLNQWLDHFVFRISIGAGVFATAFGVTLLIAMVTISYKTISAALVNPAETLKAD